eukprot:TRINITY_DN8866_c0_g1_i1.p1 TRINITY_DN8866_c0_g1~~TRINITY_DN8866_c0_g1_i1.p1  ORF type:complete len:160 (-),score=36.52 TRINITY_DN8866_c0_g1_i1:451-930(-)
MAGALKVLRHVYDRIRGQGIKETFIKARDQGFINSLLDGNLFETKVLKGEGKLVGEDKLGNKYYERLTDTQFGRHRWVEYKDNTSYNASTVPPEWHGWLHYITDYTPSEIQAFTPFYSKEHKGNQTGKGAEHIYHPKGHFQAKDDKRTRWQRVEPWKPT